MPTFKEKVTDHPLSYLATTAVTAFLVGVAVVPAITKLAKLDYIREERLAELNKKAHMGTGPVKPITLLS